MKIRNPYWPHPNTRFLINDGESCMCSTAREVDLPEDTKSVLIQPVDKGRSDAQALAPGKMWTPEHEFMELDVWADRVKVQQEKAKLEAEREKDAKRRAKEAKERGKKPAKPVVTEKPARVIEEKPLDMGGKLEL